MRTSRLTGAAGSLGTLVVSLIIVAWPVPAGAQAERCAEPNLGAPGACLSTEGEGTATSLPSDTPEPDPGPPLWVGAVFGVSGLAGIAFATARVRAPVAQERA